MDDRDRAAAEAGGELKHGAQEVARAARERTREVLDRSRRAAADRIEQTASTLHGAADQMRDQSGGLAAIADEVAERVRSASRLLREQNLDALIRSATDMARRQPAVFFGASVAAGFALARFLKASASRREGAGDAPAEPFEHSERYQAFGAEPSAPEQA